MRLARAAAFGFALSFLVTTPQFAAAQAKAKSVPAAPVAKIDPQSINIPYQKFVLDNGLTLLVHEDRKAPIVAVNVWYHVGSKNEPAGRSGFAHLFEHLMFNGSENYDQDYFQALERIGATDLNGTTNEDRTNYFQNVPANGLDQVLFLESDRMGHLLGAVDQPLLDEQRGVVQNEKRQWENTPYSVAEELITKATFPAHHPYSHTVIGSMADLDAAKLEDVKEWFSTYYGAANAVVVVAGDIDAATALAKVKHYFGDIPAGPPVARYDQWPARLTESSRQSVHDRVPQARLIRVFNIPGWGTQDAVYLDLASDVLGSGKTSRLYKRLVYDDQIATNVSVGIDQREIAGQFRIEATARPGDDLSKVEKAIDEEMAKFLDKGIMQDELDRVRTQYFSRFITGIERIGGFGGKSDILAQSTVYGGSPETYKRTLKYVADAKPADLQAASKRWLTGGVYNLEVLPFPQYSNAKEGADRSKLPDLGQAPAPVFPGMEKATLANGLKVIVANRKSIPAVNMSMMLDAGYAADQGANPGTASLAMNMLDEGTKTRGSLQISDELARLGASINSGSDLDTSFVVMTALKAALEPSLALYADIILNPSFPADDFARLQKQQIAGIQREKVNPVQMALRVFPKLLYGEGHAYSVQFTGSGTEASVASLTRDELAKFHSTWFKPNNATLIVVGDTTMAELRPLLEKAFASWKQGSVPTKNVARVAKRTVPEVYIVDKPGAIQSTILAGHVTVPRNNPNETAITAMNNILGGQFTSRVNMNLREDKHWSYGAQTLLFDARGQRPFLAYAGVQTDKTKESMIEIRKELTDIASTRPVTQDELDKVKNNSILELPGSWETNNNVLVAISDIVRYGLPEDYWAKYPTEVKSLDRAKVDGAAKEVVNAGGLVWIIVGDRAKIEAGIRELNLGEVSVMDADGNVVK
ncbi:MAG: M16 family metallopeptidase [Thermoanaerobaculia bacterium]